jgi:hypothetical protein
MIAMIAGDDAWPVNSYQRETRIYTMFVHVIGRDLNNLERALQIYRSTISRLMA